MILTTKVMEDSIFWSRRQKSWLVPSLIGIPNPAWLNQDFCSSVEAVVNCYYFIIVAAVLVLGIGVLLLLFVLLTSLRVASHWCDTLRELLHHPIFGMLKWEENRLWGLHFLGLSFSDSVEFHPFVPPKIWPTHVGPVSPNFDFSILKNIYCKLYFIYLLKASPKRTGK